MFDSKLLQLALQHRAANPPPNKPTVRRTPQRRHGKVLYVGDSLGVGTTPFMPGVRRNVKGGRPSSEGVKIVRRGAKSARAIVFDLGTNDPSARDLRRSLRRVKRAAGDRPVYALKIQGGPKAAAKNRVLRRSGVTVINTDPAGVAPDGIHAANYRRRAKLVKRALRSG